MSTLNLKSSTAGGVGVLKVDGSIDAHVAPQFDKELKSLLAQTKKIVIDVSGLEYIATAGLGVLMASFNDAHSHGGNLVISGMSTKIRKVFDTMGFSKVLKIFDTIDQAKSAL